MVRRYEPQAWPLAYDALVAAIDSFCALLPGDRGDRIRVDRVAMGAAVTWAVALDDVEIGRFALTPEGPNGYGWHVHATALKRDAGDDVERDRHAVFGEIWGDLERHIELRAGIRKPGATLQQRRVFRSEPPLDRDVILAKARDTIDRMIVEGKLRGTAQRRLRVLEMILDDANYREMAQTLYISEETAKHDAQWLRDNDLLP